MEGSASAIRLAEGPLQVPDRGSISRAIGPLLRRAARPFRVPRHRFATETPVSSSDSLSKEVTANSRRRLAQPSFCAFDAGRHESVGADDFLFRGHVGSPSRRWAGAAPALEDRASPTGSSPRKPTPTVRLNQSYYKGVLFPSSSQSLKDTRWSLA